MRRRLPTRLCRIVCCKTYQNLQKQWKRDAAGTNSPKTWTSDPILPTFDAQLGPSGTPDGAEARPKGAQEAPKTRSKRQTKNGRKSFDFWHAPGGGRRHEPRPGGGRILRRETLLGRGPPQKVHLQEGPDLRYQTRRAGPTPAADSVCFAKPPRGALALQNRSEDCKFLLVANADLEPRRLRNSRGTHENIEVIWGEILFFF